MSDTEKPRILAVDDSRVMRVAIKKILGKDYDVIEAEHGEDAWTLLTHDDNIQVVFTDLSMPYLDGYGLLERMRTSDDVRIASMPVIIITGKEDDDEAKQQALEKGADDFISKPFESIQLQARAKTHVKFKQTSTQLNDVSTQLEIQAAVDEVTGLGGQRYFCKAAEETIAYIRRHGGQYVLVRMDIDDFNPLFIKIGKQAADSILRIVGQHMNEQVRDGDMLARIGLAKFAMLLRDTSVHNAEEFARRVQEIVCGLSFNIGGETFKVSVSTGLYEPDPASDNNIQQQINETEKCLAAARQQGQNQIVTQTAVHSFTPESVNLETALALLEQGDSEALIPQANALITRMLPLLNFLGKHFNQVSELSENLKKKINK